MSEVNKALVRRLLERAYNAKDLTVADEVIAQDYVGNFNGHERRGPEGVKEHFSGDHAGWPDSHLAIEDQMAEGDKVLTRWIWTGTNTGTTGLGLATNKYSVCPGVVISRIRGGKIIEEWWYWDSLGWLKQLGFADFVKRT
jgi:predicted ester cyclase